MDSLHTPSARLSKDEIVRLRKKHLSPSLSLSYSSSIKNGLHIVRGKDQYLWDSDGVRYLDCRNNVQHIGHCHDTITQAVASQLSTLNTNTRYLDENTVIYAKELTSLLPAPLECATFVNSGSEANEFALRIASSWFVPKRKEFIAFEHGYHGNTTNTVAVSYYKLIDQPSKPLPVPSTTHFLSIPDLYRGRHLNDKRFDLRLKDDEDAVCDYYIETLSALIDDVDPKRDRIAAFIGETVIGCGGQVFLPRKFLFKCKRLLNAKYIDTQRPLMIMDEVQCGFGRLGAPFYWAFQHNTGSESGFVPDILSLGKSIGNGFPLGCTVASREILDAFKRNNNDQEYFNTFGGNAVSMKAGLGVIRILKNGEHRYLKHIQEVGLYFVDSLRRLQCRVNGSDRNQGVYIGDIRGKGLFIGIEMVTDLETKEPAERETALIVNRLAQKPFCLLLSTDGPFESVIKIKPPICFTKDNAYTVVRCLETVLLDRVLLRIASKL